MSIITPPKTIFSSPSEFLKSQPTAKFEPMSDEKTHHRITEKSTAQVKVMTPICSIGVMGPPQNPPVKHELPGLDASFVDSPANSSGYYFDYQLNAQPNFTSTPVIVSKSLQGQVNQMNEPKMVRCVFER